MTSSTADLRQSLNEARDAGCASAAALTLDEAFALLDVAEAAGKPRLVDYDVASGQWLRAEVDWPPLRQALAALGEAGE